MPIKYIVSDWNGTLISYPDEGKLMERIGKDILKNSGVHHPVRSVQLLMHMFHLKDMVGWYKSGGISYKEIYDYFNPYVLEGTPKEIINRAVEKYAEEAYKEMDVKLLKVVSDRHNNRILTGVLSTGYRNGIVKTLQKAAIQETSINTPIIFDLTIANDIVWRDGKKGMVAEKFDLRIYNNKEKYLESIFFRSCGFNPKTTAYIGDTDEDEKCLEMVEYPVVSKFADDGFKQRMATKFNNMIRIAEKSEDYESILTKD